MAWLGGWARRVKISVDSGDVTAALTDFPVLIHLSSSCGINSQDLTYIFDMLQLDANRFKIAVTNANGVTQLYVEVEEWDDANEEAWLWCKIPSIASGIDTNIYLYYDITHANNTAWVGDPNSVAAENVWNADYMFVSHMRDDPGTSNIRDSTSSNFDGTKGNVGQPTVVVNGIIGESQDFESVNSEYITLGDVMDVGNNDMCYSFWIKTSDTADMMLLCKYNPSVAANGLRISETFLGKMEVKFGDGTTDKTITSTSGIVSGGGPAIYVAIILDNDGNGYVVINGGSAEGTTDISDVGYVSNPNDFLIGVSEVDSLYFKGIIDEVRVSNSNPSSAWIKATYETQRDDLLDFARFELAPTEIGVFPLPPPPRIPIRRRFTSTIPLSVTIRQSYTATLPVQINVRVPWRATITHKMPIQRKFTESFTQKRAVVTKRFIELMKATAQVILEE